MEAKWLRYKPGVYLSKIEFLEKTEDFQGYQPGGFPSLFFQEFKFDIATCVYEHHLQNRKHGKVQKQRIKPPSSLINQFKDIPDRCTLRDRLLPGKID